MRWLVPFFLLLAGWWLEWGPGTRPDPAGGSPSSASAITYVGIVGAAQVLGISGGRIGRALAGTLTDLVTAPGAFVLLVALAHRRRGRRLRDPAPTAHQACRSARPAGWARPPRHRSSGRRPRRRRLRPPSARPRPRRTARTAGRNGKTVAGRAVARPDRRLGRRGRTRSRPRSRARAQTSTTFAPARGRRLGARCVARCAPARDPDDVTDGSDSPPTKDRIEYILPPITILEDVADPGPCRRRRGGPRPERGDHRQEAGRLRDPGPDRRPQRRPGRDPVRGPAGAGHQGQPDRGRCPTTWRWPSPPARSGSRRRSRARARSASRSRTRTSTSSPLRRVLEEVDFKASESTLTFALGRDVAGVAKAVDLAKMPHLLIAGATGSGKSVMVNAVITSLLCKATPDDVRMILMDLKRVELAAYNGLPHLLVPVITEPERAKAALKWAVNEMEARYRRLAGASARNIRAFNETRADPEDRMPYIVIIIDELADLMMREGKNVEDPIVRLAQKARATGIHMVLATQRPSVNVVTGLIKANFPSRIAFAMASQIDSRTILDAPGAEDLIGRGDMLYQPSDLPRPMRLQGVFVSDAEIGRVVDHWKAQIDDPHYDMPIIDTGDEGTGSVDDLADEDADRLLPDAIEVIREYDRASASLLQRRLKVGYARAARMIDQLEARGYIGAFDGSNARQVLRRDEPTGAGGLGRRRRRGRRMTTREQLKRAVGIDRSDAGRGRRDGAGAQPARAPVRRPRAQGRRPLPGRARHQDPGALPRRPRARRLQGAARRGLHQGLPAQLRALPRPRPGRGPGPVAARARRRQGAAAGHRRPAPDRGAAQGPDLLAEHRRRGPADGGHRRVRGLSRDPGPALRQAADDRGHPAGDRGHRRRRVDDDVHARGNDPAGRHGLDRDAGPRAVPGHRRVGRRVGGRRSTCAAGATSST